MAAPRVVRRSRLALGIFTLCLLCAPSHVTAARWVTPPAATTINNAALENACQCDCCYTVGANGRTDCVPPSATSFDVQTCAECDVDACSNMFPITCAQASSIVTSDCIVRKGWILEFVPLFFISITVVLVAYGLYKKFDGYHDVRTIPTLDPARHMLSDPVLGYDSIPDPYPPPSSMRHVRSPSGELGSSMSRSRLSQTSEIDQLSVDDSGSMPLSSRANPPLDPIPELAPLGETAVQHKSQSSQTL